VNRTRWLLSPMLVCLVPLAAGCGSSEPQAPAALTNPSNGTEGVAPAHPVAVKGTSAASIGDQRSLSATAQIASRIEARQAHRRAAAASSKPSTQPAQNANGGPTASAAFTALETISVSGVCDYGKHSNSIAVSVMFNGQRFPQGAYTTVRLAWAQFNPGNQAQKTSRWFITRWLQRRFTPRAAVEHPSTFGSFTTVSPSTLGSWTLPAHSGVFKAQAMVAVWDGRRWEDSPWIPAAGYLNSQDGVSPLEASTCWVGPF